MIDAVATADAGARTRPPIRIPAQNAISVMLAGLVMGGWTLAHVAGVFFLPLTVDLSTVLGGAALFLVLCWLNTGLFILAHDAMHGTLVVGNRAANAVIGQICLTLYAGFRFHALNEKHHDHHRYPGSPEDPDFNTPATRAFWPWYLGFFYRYFGWREALVLALIFNAYVHVLGAPIANMILFWAAPSILASAQLFYFGTYLPHRPDAEGFVDAHNSRSNTYPWIWSLLTCFHFGYHLEHHRYPYLPWWRLPEARVL